MLVRILSVTPAWAGACLLTMEERLGTVLSKI